MSTAKTLTINPEGVLAKLNIHEQDSRRYIWDPIRRKNVLLNKEEWVRQIFIGLLADFFPISRMAVEKRVKVNGLDQRFDLLIYDKELQPFLLAEFKNPDISLDDKVFHQALRYNQSLKVPYLLLSNGMVHYLCKYVSEQGRFEFYEDWPFEKK
jgi:hypothetical protein